MKLLEIKEEFITKGSLLGMPALFFCFGEKEGSGQEMDVDELLKTAEKSVMRYMVVTGELGGQGEELKVFIEGLRNLYRHVVVESDASEYLELDADLVSLDLNFRSPGDYGRSVWPKENINAYLATARETELRIYIDDEVDLREVFIALSEHSVPRSKVFLVPTGGTFEEYLESLAFLSKECLKYSFRLGARLDHSLDKAQKAEG